MPAPIVGRDGEWRAIERLLEGAATGPRVLVMEGAPGIGKSSIWRAALAESEERGFRNLVSAPAETEQGLPYTGLHDLLSRIPDTDIAALPEPQARALRAALYRSDPSEGTADAAAVAIAASRLLQRMAERGPLLLAVDDLQWLDASSAAVFRFCLRRLGSARVAVLICRRSGSADTAGSDLAPADNMEQVAVGPLSLGALHRIVEERLGVRLARPALVRLHESTEGNPYLALELVRAYGPEGPAAMLQGAPPPEVLRTALGRRIESLPKQMRRLVEATALLGRPPRSLLLRLMGGDDTTDATAANLARAERAGLLRAEGDRVRIDHPLLASVIAGSILSTERRGLHRRIAEAIDEGPERARHLAAASDGPDEAIAAALDLAAGGAAALGASIEAADLRDLALRLTPTDRSTAVGRRRLALAEAFFTAGDTGRARRELEDALPALAERDQRLEGLLLLARVRWYEQETEACVEIAEQALGEAADDRAWQARIHAALSWMLDFDLTRRLTHATAALELIDPDAEPALQALPLLNQAWTRLLTGHGADHAAIERADRLQQKAGRWDTSPVPGYWAKAMDQPAVARQRFRGYLDQARASGEESAVAGLLAYLAEMECWVGNVDEAEVLVEEAVEAAEQTDQRVYLAISLGRRALVRTYRGDLAAGKADAERSLALAHPPLLPPGPLAVLGLIALTEDDPERADDLLSQADAMLEGIGMREPASHRFHADHIEAVIRLGDLDRAERLLERFEARARSVPRPWIVATAARCRGLLLAARGDLPAALASFEAALTAHEQLEMPLELGRTLLAHGQLLRRAGRRKLAEASFQRSLELFDGLRCRPWADRARGELERLGIHRGKEETLTPSEERMARLAASGMTNRIIADRLSISPKTVEANLARAYAKLGIRSRAELGAIMGTERDQHR